MPLIHSLLVLILGHLDQTVCIRGKKKACLLIGGVAMDRLTNELSIGPQAKEGPRFLFINKH